MLTDGDLNEYRPRASTSEIETYLRNVIKKLLGRGAERTAQCPRASAHAHGDRNPSCSVNVERGVLYCHVCALKGNIEQLWYSLGWPRPPWLNGSGNRNHRRASLINGSGTRPALYLAEARPGATCAKRDALQSRNFQMIFGSILRSGITKIRRDGNSPRLSL